MEKVSKKQILLIVLVLICSLGLTYAFYGALIGPVAKTSTDVISGTNDRLVFNPNGTLNFTLNQNNMQSGSGNVTNSITPSATLFANNVNNTASSTYNVYFEITSNNFVRSNGRTPEVLIKIFNPYGVEITSVIGLNHITINGASGFDITTKTGVFTIAENYVITSNDSSVGVTQNWTFTLVGLNLTIDQSANIGHTIETNVKLQHNAIFEEQTFSYTGDYEEFVVPVTGNYKIELWGAQGGYSYIDNDIHYYGGYGGYTVGQMTVDANTPLYIYVGGKGSRCVCSSSKTCCGENGGFNGGGKSLQYTGGNTYYGSGGGATHIATKIGLLSTLSTDPSSIIMVAGGGGGASNWQGTATAGYNWIGGSAGGYLGSQGSYSRTDRTNTCTGGNQDAAGSGTYNAGSAFGIGGNPLSLYGPGGGGGYYGGGTSETASCGGSGYINTTKLTNAKMVCFNCDQSTTYSTFATTNASLDPISEYAKMGNGFARITFLS